MTLRDIVAAADPDTAETLVAVLTAARMALEDANSFVQNTAKYGHRADNIHDATYAASVRENIRGALRRLIDAT